MTFRFDKGLLESHGFKVEPEVRPGRRDRAAQRTRPHTEPCADSALARTRPAASSPPAPAPSAPVTRQVVSRLPGAPDFASAEVSVTLLGNRSGVQPGPLELVYPIAMKGSPPVLLTLRAHVQVPDLRLSTEVRWRGS